MILFENLHVLFPSSIFADVQGPAHQQLKNLVHTMQKLLLYREAGGTGREERQRAKGDRRGVIVVGITENSTLVHPYVRSSFRFQLRVDVPSENLRENIFLYYLKV